jgi:L-threonylcarbamoyladenylate synthase
MPLHRVALELLNVAGPLAVTSANLTGQPPATTAEGALEQLGAAVEVYLDAGPSQSTVASTIVDVTGDTPVVLRQGSLTLAQLRAVAPSVVPGLA